MTHHEKEHDKQPDPIGGEQIPVDVDQALADIAARQQPQEAAETVKEQASGEAPVEEDLDARAHPVDTTAPPKVVVGQAPIPEDEAPGRGKAASAAESALDAAHGNDTQVELGEV